MRPPLFPADAGARGRVEEAERCGGAVLRPIPRRLAGRAIKRERKALWSLPKEPSCLSPIGLAIRGGGPIISFEIRTHRATDETVQADPGRSPGGPRN